ncbi:hypothetical protein [Exiguobacterium sp. SRB7LM]|uniref:hypothetical protein n=1 Tax=Exiguobacterium sp. SRB7LM TaxID=2608401 RepID=UPI0018C392E4|nr:hypothetical protein [Exiguobacterium sp. SRB7LM]
MAHNNAEVRRIEQVRPGLFYIYTDVSVHWAGVKVVADLLGRTIADTRRLSILVR